MSYVSSYFHCVFSTKERSSQITPDLRERLWPFLGGIERQNQMKAIEVGGMPDHVHILIGQRPDSSLSDLVGDVKAGSTNFINRQRWVRGRFRWQEGFGAFSYSRSQLDTVVRYVKNQQRHHQKRSFHDEYVSLLDKFDVPYDVRYVFKPVYE